MDSPSFVSISAITPDPAEGVSPGQTVELKVKGDYTLTPKTGTLGLTVQDGSGGRSLGSTSRPVKRDGAAETLTVKFTVPTAPKSDTVDVFLFLQVPDLTNGTPFVDHRSYKVVIH